MFNTSGKIYTGDGELKTKVANTSTRIDYGKGQVVTVDRLLYLWVPSENKAELFYRLRSGYVQTGSNYSASDDAGYVKASDVDYDYGHKWSIQQIQHQKQKLVRLSQLVQIRQNSKN